MNRHRIRAHRWRGTKRVGPGAFRDPSESIKQLSTRMMGPFAEVFVAELGAAIHERIAAGRWHKSRNKRYNSYRTWLQYRYGSDRARKATPGVALAQDDWIVRDYGGKRKNIIKRMQTPGAYENMPEILKDPIMFAQFDYIRRVLLSKAELYEPNTAVARRFLTPQQREARYKLRLNNQETVDVHEAVKFLQEFMLGETAFDPGTRSMQSISGEGYVDLLRAGKRKEADARKRKYAQQLEQQGEIFTQWLRGSKAGQRLLRDASKRALKVSRHTFTLQATDRARSALEQRTQGANAPDFESIRTVKDASGAKAKRLMREYKSGRKITPVVAGNFAFGYQTGKLAESWRVADYTAKRINDKWRFVVMPTDEGDKLPRGSLTVFLKRIIGRQGGNPKLVTKQMLQRSMREAVNDANVRAGWASMGIRTKRSRR